VIVLILNFRNPLNGGSFLYDFPYENQITFHPVNPVKKKPQDYPWSSYRYFVTSEKGPAVLTTSFILGHFSGRGKSAKYRYREFVEGDAVDENDDFLKKIFTDRELSYSFEKRFPYQHLAARFAAKEATLKAFGNGWGRSVSLDLIEVSNDEDGKPQISLNGVLRILYEQRNLKEIVVSMSHSIKFAVASCILVKNGSN